MFESGRREKKKINEFVAISRLDIGRYEVWLHGSYLYNDITPQKSQYRRRMCIHTQFTKIRLGDAT